ncbi:PEP-CTERM sorting domain-containing protein [Paucibacter sp. B2R-40]|uniref:PEP-CTERM sorting domain-containing protein n=1 Tax=Paucibacter sp. B2R-40 TaxID=2893554 RepID=UPI0021E485FE|nr:PEP-CTERM sorting domain-containing protein [Paucibacter sp. B2R-40]MCV2356007.1 PEP-CTERM sorting domain-containing protein [Paucibacter sp. B2R-40]
MHRFLKACTGFSLAALLLAAGSAQAEDFQFSYRFNTGELVTGSFAGTLSGDMVSDISQLAVSINGVAFGGTLNAFSYTSPGNQCPSCFAATGAMASFNPLKNNFYFSDGNAVSGTGITNYFYVIPWPNGSDNPVASQAYINNTAINAYNGQYVPQNWILSAVPEPASIPMMLLGLAGIAGLAGQRLRGQRKPAASAQA